MIFSAAGVMVSVCFHESVSGCFAHDWPFSSSGTDVVSMMAFVSPSRREIDSPPLFSFADEREMMIYGAIVRGVLVAIVAIRPFAS